MSTASAPLNAESRTNAGKGVARALRRDGKVPAILYGGKGAPVSLALSARDVALQYKKGRFQNRLLELNLDGKVVKALPRDVQFHPVTDQIEHVDFMKIEAGSIIRVEIPVKFFGADKAPGIKRGGVLNVVRHEIEFTCKVESIPSHIEVDISTMEIGDSLHINAIKLPEGVSPVIKRNFTVATVAGRSAQMDVTEEAKPEAAAAEGAAAAPAAGAAPAADAKKDEGKK